MCIVILKFIENFERMIRRMIICYYHLKCWIILAQDLRQVLPQIMRLIKRCHDDGNRFHAMISILLSLPLKYFGEQAHPKEKQDQAACYEEDE